MNDVYRETFGSAVDLSVDALQALGLPKQRAIRAAELFRKARQTVSVRDMAHIEEDDMTLHVVPRRRVGNLENALAADRDLEAEQAAAEAADMPEPESRADER